MEHGARLCWTRARQRQILVDLPLALFQAHVRIAQPRLGAFEVRNVGEGNNREFAPFGILETPRAHDDRQAPAVAERQHKFKTVASCRHTQLDLLQDEGKLVGLVEVRAGFADQLRQGHAGHFLEAGVDVENPVAVVGDDHAFVQRFKQALELLDPFRLVDVHEVSFPIHLMTHSVLHV